MSLILDMARVVGLVLVVVLAVGLLTMGLIWWCDRR